MMSKRLIFATALAAQPLVAETPEEDAFVEANVLGIFYHELGHALIDIEGVPIFGQEEDAADVFSIFLIDALFDSETAEALAYDASLGFWAEADARGEDVAWWDVHGPDEQRFYNTVCIFYGADPEARETFAEDLDLPEDRADYCPDEYDQAKDAWGGLLDELVARGSGDSLRLAPGPDSLTRQVLKGEIKALNAEMTLSDPLEIVIADCDEANAFYDPEATQITFCTELEAHLRDLFDAL